MEETALKQGLETTHSSSKPWKRSKITRSGPAREGTDQPDDKGSDKEKETKNERKTKVRHRFSAEQLQKLKAEFTQSPYPDYETRKKLAKQFHCEAFIIYTWFQNKRARLALEERRRLFLRWRQENKMPVSQDSQARPPAPNYTKMQSASHPQGSLVSGAACSQQEGPAPGGVIANQTSFGVCQNDRGNGPSSAYPSPGSSSATRVQRLTPFVQYFDGEWAGVEARQFTGPFLPHYASCTQMRKEGQQYCGDQCHPQQPPHPHDQGESTWEYHQEQMQGPGSLGHPWPSYQRQPQQGRYPQASGETLSPPFWPTSPQDDTGYCSLYSQSDHQQNSPRNQPQQSWGEGPVV